MRVVVSPFTSWLLSKLDMRPPSYWVKGVMLEHGELDTFLEEGINAPPPPPQPAFPVLHQMVWSLILQLKFFPRLLMQRILLFLDDPLENIQLQRAQQNLKSSGNAQKSKRQPREGDESKTPQPAALAWLESALPASSLSASLSATFCVYLQLKKKKIWI